MNYKCCVPNCNERNAKNIMYRFPHPKSKLYLFNTWMKRINNSDMAKFDCLYIYYNRRVCCKHFDPSCIVEAEGTNVLRHGALPTLNLPSFSKESIDNCNTRFMKNSTNFVPLLDVEEEIEINKTLGDLKQDKPIIKVEEITEVDPLQQETYEELLNKYELLNKNFDEYEQKAEKEINSILGFITDKKKKGFCTCPKCSCIRPSVQQMKVHLLAHVENRVCDICSKVFYTETALVSHSKLHRLKRIILLKKK